MCLDYRLQRPRRIWDASVSKRSTKRKMRALITAMCPPQFGENRSLTPRNTAGQHRLLIFVELSITRPCVNRFWWHWVRSCIMGNRRPRNGQNTVSVKYKVAGGAQVTINVMLIVQFFRNLVRGCIMHHGRRWLRNCWICIGICIMGIVIKA